jgi:membrane protease YdiL (CAAX protease family)
MLEICNLENTPRSALSISKAILDLVDAFLGLKYLAVIVLGSICGLVLATAGILFGDALNSTLSQSDWRKLEFVSIIYAANPLLQQSFIISCLAIGFLSAACLIFRRSWLSFITSRKQFSSGLFLAGLALFSITNLVVIFSVTTAPSSDSPLTFYKDWRHAAFFCVLVVAYAAPMALAEDILFRGWLVKFSREINSKSLLFVFGSSVLFSVAHLQWDLASLVLRFASGLAYAWAVMRLGGLEFSFGAHLGKNTVLVWLLGQSGQFDWKYSYEIAVYTNVVGSIGLILMVETFIRLRQVKIDRRQH